MRSLVLLLVGGMSLACGGDDRPGGGRDGGPGSDGAGPCSPGEVECRGREVWECESGEFQRREVCGDDQVCALGLGCRACQPGRPFCDGQEVRICAEDGVSSELQMTCPESQVCSGASCQDACAVAASERSNVGCEYMAVDLDNEYSNDPFGIGGGSTPPADEQFSVVLANPANVLVQAQVWQSDGSPNSAAPNIIATYQVPPNDLLQIDLPTRNVDGSSPTSEGTGTHLSNRAYRITTNFPVVAYQFNPIVQSFSNDASLLIPVPALDVHYRILGWGTANPIAPLPIGDPETDSLPDRSFVTIVGTQAGTNVRVTVGHNTNAGMIDGGGGSIAATSAGGVIEQIIGPYDVLNISTDGIPGDLSGTVVEASAPVAVFSGGERGIAPLDTAGVSAHPSGMPDDWCCTEHLEEQVFPTTAWGKIFAVTRSPVRSAHATWKEPDLYRIMADKPGTVVTTNLPAPNDSFTLNTNEWRDISSDRSFTVMSSEAVSIQQILVSQGWVVDWKSGHGGDPSMILYPPIEQYRDNYVFLAPPTFDTNYVVISAISGTEILLDGRSIDEGEFLGICVNEEIGIIDGAPYIAVTCPISGGTHTVSGSQPVGINVYGYHNVGSYGYAGGSNLTQINPLI